jgi:hypothetical protein
MLTYADVCGRMLTYADVFGFRLLRYEGDCDSSDQTFDRTEASLLGNVSSDRSCSSGRGGGEGGGHALGGYLCEETLYGEGGWAERCRQVLSCAFTRVRALFGLVADVC